MTGAGVADLLAALDRRDDGSPRERPCWPIDAAALKRAEAQIAGILAQRVSDQLRAPERAERRDGHAPGGGGPRDRPVHRRGSAAGAARRALRRLACQAMASRNIVVCGAGLMGHGIAQVMAAAGHNVALYEPDLARAEAGRARIDSNLQRAVAKEKITDEARQEQLGRVSVAQRSGRRSAPTPS